MSADKEIIQAAASYEKLLTKLNPTQYITSIRADVLSTMLDIQYNAGMVQGREAERKLLREEYITVVRILCDQDQGAAFNAVTEDHPEIAETIGALKTNT